MPSTHKVSTTKGDAAQALFEHIASRDHQPLLNNTVGRLRIDLTEGGTTEHLFIIVDKGVVDISHRRARAEAALHCPRALFNQMAEGNVNALAAILRGELNVEGDLSLLAAFSRLFPGPPASLESFHEREKRVSHD